MLSNVSPPHHVKFETQNALLVTSLLLVLRSFFNNPTSGDMEHTHLVKGLDYALLQKVKAEIVFKETESVDMQQENSQVQKSGKPLIDRRPLIEIYILTIQQSLSCDRLHRFRERKRLP